MGRVARMLPGQNIDLLPLTVAHAPTPLGTPLPHQDPFDEPLLVQAQAEGLKRLTRDAKPIGHPLAERAI